jgi:TIR domain
MANPAFFFSYARADRDGAGTTDLNALDRGQCNAIDAFYLHLCNQVAALMARPADEVGFFDRENLQLGAPWPSRLTEALRSSSVMIALFSPTYFSRHACGREFEIFRCRHKALEEKLGRSADFRVLPVLWVRPDVTYASIPSCCREYINNLQRTGPKTPASYSTYGLMRMFELGLVTETNAICHGIADRIYALLNDEALPKLEELDFNTVESAFHETAPAGLPRPIDRTKREIRVYYLVPNQAEWSAEGAKGDEFADVREKARPFSDAPGATISSATEEGIAESKMDVGVTHEPLPDDLADALQDTNDSMTTPLVVFDRRALRVPTLKSAVASYASRNFENAGFVTVAGEDVPKTEVDAVCGVKVGALPKLHNWNVPKGRKTYVSNVASIVVELQTQLVRRRMERSRPSGEAVPGLSVAGSI